MQNTIVCSSTILTMAAALNDFDSDDDVGSSSDDEVENVDVDSDFDSDNDSYYDSGDESEDGFRVKFSPDFNSTPGDDWKWGRQGWDVPAEYGCLWITDGVVEPENEQYQRLMDLLLHDKRIWETIYLSGHGLLSSAEFLSMLRATFSKADALHLAGCMLDNAAFECLNSGLMTKGGMRDLELWTSPRRPMTRPQMSLLSQGLSSTTTLETLKLPMDLTRPGVVQYLIAGLSANTSLQYLQSCWCKYPPDTLPSVISALHSHPALRRLMLRTEELRLPQVQASLQSLLSRDDCKLEDVDLWRGIGRHEQDNPTSRFSLGKFDNANTPLKCLHLCNLGIERSSLRTMLSSCKFLVELSLNGNQLSDLAPLDCLLLGESCSLERLELEENPITVNDARIFAQKLPKMKILRRLELRANPFLKDREFLNEFLHNANQNTSMERLGIFTTHNQVAALRPKLMYGPCLNRAGRRYLGHNPGILPLELLPTVFVRAREIYYYGPMTNEPTVQLDGLDATFWLLRENSTLHSQFV